jgi:1-acyl-sn-glycerol-3-phosphate acyltransferase
MSAEKKVYDQVLLDSHPRDEIDSFVDEYLTENLTSQIIKDGTDLIPQKGIKFAFAFGPHTGWADALIFRTILREFGHKLILISKEENFHGIKKLIVGERRAFPIKRYTVDRKALRTSNAVLNHGDIPGSAIQGTRSLTLNEAEPGLVYMAHHSRVPLLVGVTTGAENIIPRPEIYYEKYGAPGYAILIYDLIKMINSDDKPTLTAQFTTVYEDHLNDPNWKAGQRVATSQYHAHKVMLDHIIPHLNDWPLGFYKGMKLNPETRKLEATTP